MQIVQIEDNQFKKSIVQKVLVDSGWYGLIPSTEIVNRVDNQFFAALNHNYTYVGFIALKSNSDEVLEIDSFAVAKSAKKMKGGLTLIDGAKQVAKAMGKKMIVLKIKECPFVKILKKAGYFIIDTMQYDSTKAYILGYLC